MQIILKKDVENLGYKDDLVSVRDGYARNFLIPRGLCVTATDSALKVRAENIKQKEHREAKLRDEAKAFADKLRKVGVQVGAKVGEGGKIFGSVNNIQVADAIKAKLGVEVDRKKINLHEADKIKNVGKYTATIKLFKDIAETFEFEVVEE